MAPLAGCGEKTALEKPTDAELKQMRASAQAVQTGAGNTLDSKTGTPLFQFPGMAYRDWTVKETAVDALARIGESAVPVLIEALSDPNPDVRKQAARSLARMGDAGKAAVPVLIERLQDPDEEVRQAAARALGQMGAAAAEAVPALIAIIKQGETTAAPRTSPAPISRRP